MAFVVMWKVAVLLVVVQVMATVAGDQLHKGGPEGLMDSEEYDGSTTPGGRRQLLTSNKFNCFDELDCTKKLSGAYNVKCCYTYSFPSGASSDCVDVGGYDNENCGACFSKCSGCGNQCCYGTCTNTTSDPENCGACKSKCSGYGRKCCDGKCVDTTSDPKNCGTCKSQCPRNLQCCDGKCVSTKDDEKNCGSCGKKCPNSCKNGSCI